MVVDCTFLRIAVWPLSIGQNDEMTYQDGDHVATHSEPIWRDRGNFVSRVRIEAAPGERRWEQLWWTKVTNSQFILCCIPFFAYDLALGDEVELDVHRHILAVVKPSGQWTFRAWFGGVSANDKKTAIVAIQAHAPLMEWSSENLLALSASTEGAQALADTLQGLSESGSLQYETGRIL